MSTPLQNQTDYAPTTFCIIWQRHSAQQFCLGYKQHRTFLVFNDWRPLTSKTKFGRNDYAHKIPQENNLQDDCPQKFRLQHGEVVTVSIFFLLCPKSKASHENEFFSNSFWLPKRVRRFRILKAQTLQSFQMCLLGLK